MSLITEAKEKYPTPKFSVWYTTKFPKLAFNVTELSLFLIGFILTIVNNSVNNVIIHKIIGAVTLTFCIVLIPVAVIHTVAWYLKRENDKKIAEYMDISLEEYYEYYGDK